MVDLIELDKLISAGRQRVILPKQPHCQTQNPHVEKKQAAWCGGQNLDRNVSPPWCTWQRRKCHSAGLPLDTLLLRLAKSADQAICPPCPSQALAALRVGLLFQRLKCPCLPQAKGKHRPFGFCNPWKLLKCLRARTVGKASLGCNGHRRMS